MREDSGERVGPSILQVFIASRCSSAFSLQLVALKFVGLAACRWSVVRVGQRMDEERQSSTGRSSSSSYFKADLNPLKKCAVLLISIIRSTVNKDKKKMSSVIIEMCSRMYEGAVTERVRNGLYSKHQIN